MIKPYLQAADLQHALCQAAHDIIGEILSQGSRARLQQLCLLPQQRGKTFGIFSGAFVLGSGVGGWRVRRRVGGTRVPLHLKTI